ncbi:MAG: helix-hairpin-helix domain-containing protein, partial [Actinomycetota bacterium]
MKKAAIPIRRGAPGVGPATAGDLLRLGITDLRQLKRRSAYRLYDALCRLDGPRHAPSVIDLGDGHLVLFYEGGDGAPGIGRADSTDDGATWSKHPANPLLTAVRSPGAAVVDDTWMIFASRDGEAGIWRATSSDGATFVLDATPVVRPRAGLATAFDGESVANPDVVVTRTGADRSHIGLFFTGGARVGSDLIQSIGYAGSFDGISFDRFGGPDAVLAQGVPSEVTPSVVVPATRGVMFYGEVKQGASRIGVALHP